MKYEMPRGSFGGDRWVDFYYTWDSPDWQANTCGVGSNTFLERPSCAAGRLIEVVDQRHNAALNPGETIDPNLKPMESNEYQLGFTREMGNQFVIGARYVRKDLVRTIEDVGVTVSGVGTVYYISNPGEGITLNLSDSSIPTFPKARREYQALELTAQRRLSNNWMLFMNYTLSRLYGNYSGLASSDENGRVAPNVNRFFDGIENSFDRNAEYVDGRLGTDRPHNFKAQFLYTLKSNTNVGLTQRLASGIPISEESNMGAGIPFFPYGRGNMGRTDMLASTDLQLVQTFRFSRYSAYIDLTVLNLFDRDAVSRVYNSRLAGSLPLSQQEFFAGGWDYEGITAGNPDLHDFRFGQPDQFYAPREVRLAVGFRF